MGAGDRSMEQQMGVGTAGIQTTQRTYGSLLSDRRLLKGGALWERLESCGQWEPTRESSGLAHRLCGSETGVHVALSLEHLLVPFAESILPGEGSGRDTVYNVSMYCQVSVTCSGLSQRQLGSYRSGRVLG